MNGKKAANKRYERGMRAPTGEKAKLEERETGVDDARDGAKRGEKKRNSAEKEEEKSHETGPKIKGAEENENIGKNPKRVGKSNRKCGEEGSNDH